MIMLVENPDSKNGNIKMKLLSIHDGSLLKEYVHISSSKSNIINFIELFDDKVFIKFENEQLKIIEILKKPIKMIIIPKSENLKVDTFIYLYQEEHILMFKERSLRIMDLKGNIVTKFDNHILVPKYSFSLVHINETQRIIYSTCKEPLSSTSDVSQIHISSLITGKLLGKIETLFETTSIYFNEITHELCVGDVNGNITIYK